MDLTGTPDGVRLTVRGCDLWTFRDGLATRKDSFWKSAILAALGLVIYLVVVNVLVPDMIDTFVEISRNRTR